MVTADTVYSLLLDVLEAGGDVEAVTWARKHRDTVLAWIAPVVEAINTRRSRASVAGRQTVGLAAEGPRGAFVYGMLHRPLDMNLIPGALSVGQHPAFPHGIVGVREALSSEDAERLGLVRVLTDSQLEAHGRAYGRSKAKYADQVRKMGVAALAAGIARHTAGIYVPSMTQYQRWVLEGLESAPKLASSAAPVSAVPAPDKQRAAVALYRMVLDEEERRMAHASVGRRVGGDKAQLAFNQLDDTLRDFAIGLADVNGVFEPVGPGYVQGQPVSELPGHAVARLENQGAEVWLFVSPDGVKAFVQGLAGGQVYGLVGYKWQPSVVPRVFDTLGRAAREGGLAARELALIAKEAASAGAKPGHTEWDKASRASRPATDFASTLSSTPALVKPSEEPKFWHASRELTEHEREVLRTLPPDDVGAFLGVPAGGMGETAARRLGYVLWGVQSKTSPPAALLRKVGMLTTPAEVAQVVNEAFDAKRAKSSAAADDAKAVAQAMKLPGRLGRYAKMVHDAMDAAKARAVALREEGAALKAVTGSAWRESSKRKQASNEDEQAIRFREELVRLGKSGRPPWTGKLLAWWESTEGADKGTPAPVAASGLDILAPWQARAITPGEVYKLASYTDNTDLYNDAQLFSYRVLEVHPKEVVVEITTLRLPVEPGAKKYTRTRTLRADRTIDREFIADIARAKEHHVTDWPVIPPPVVKDQTLLPLNTVVRMKKGKGKLWIVAGHKGWSSDAGHGGPNELYALSGGTKGSQTSASAQDLEVMKLPDVIANANDDGVVRWEGPEAGKRYQSYSFHIGAKNRLPFVLRGHSPTWYLVAEPAYLMLLHQGAMTVRFRRDTDIRGAWETLARESKDNVGYLWAPSVVSGGIQQWAFHVIRSPADIERVLS